MELYAPGTKVLLDEDLSATITTVAIHAGNHVQYECAWWNSGTRVREWFTEDDIVKLDKREEGLQIGFVNTEA